MDESVVITSPSDEPLGTSLNKMDENVTDVGNDDSASGRSSPDANCPICLGRLENKSFTDSCLHQFCFNCLEQWSKVKAECPLCKQTFKSIIHNIRSIEDFEEHVVQTQESMFNVITYAENHYPQNYPSREPFRYRTTAVASYVDYFLRLEHAIDNHVLPPMPPPGLLETGHPWARRRQVGTSDFRRSVYQHGFWVQGVRDVPRQYRESSPEFYRLNPGMVHRLVPWLNRELNVLCGGQDNTVQLALTRVLQLINQVPINSAEFRAGVSQYVGRHTEHFVHEFNSFARSALDMIGYDRHASYVSHPNLVCPPGVGGSRGAHVVGDDDDSDVLIVGPETSPNVSIHIESDSDECVVVDSVPAPARSRSPEVITLESDDDVVQVNIHIPGPSRLRRPPLNRNWLTVKNVKSINDNVNVSINIGHSSRSRSRSVSLSSNSSCESWTPRRKRNLKLKSKKREKKVKVRKERKDSKDSKSSKESVKKLKLKRVASSCPKKAATYKVLESDSDVSPVVSPRRWRKTAVLHSSSSSSENEENKDNPTKNREQYSSSDEPEYKPRLRSVVIKTEPQPSTSQALYSHCKSEVVEEDIPSTSSNTFSPFYTATSLTDTATSASSNLSKPSSSRRRSYSTSSSECTVSKMSKHSEKKTKRNAYW